MKEVECRYCRKTIRNGRWIGTLHLCVSEEERRYIDYQMAMARCQMQQQARCIAQHPQLDPVRL